MLIQETVHCSGGTINDSPGILVPRGPRAPQQPLRANFVQSGEFVAQPIHRFSQRSSPCLLPLPIGPGVAATIALPSRNSVHETPGGTLYALHSFGSGF